MRRQEFAVVDSKWVAEIAQRCEVGYLGLEDRLGYPRVVPLNFVLLDEQIYFHGALSGEKFEVFSAGGKASFSMVGLSTLIPSYWLAAENACPATAFFESAAIRGKGVVVDQLDEKARALQSLMEKYQPEGRYRPIQAQDPMYRQALENVGVFKIIPHHVDLKVKYGQNMGKKVRHRLAAHLQRRNRGDDHAVAELIEQSLQDG